MEPGIDPRMPLEAGDGSQREHFIIPFINWALRPAGRLRGEGFIFKSSSTLLQHVYYFLHGCQCSLWRNQPVGAGPVQTGDAPLICPTLPTLLASLSRLKRHIFRRSSVFFLGSHGGHGAVRHSLYVNACILSTALRARTWRRLCTFILLC